MPSTRSRRLSDLIPGLKARGTLDQSRALYQRHTRDIAPTATVTASIAAVLAGPGALKRVTLASTATHAAHATDYWDFIIQDGSTTVATWSTKDTSNGALTALVPGVFTMVLPDRQLADRAVLTYSATKNGSAVNFTGRLTIEIDPVIT